MRKKLRVGFMPLAFGSYWESFPEYKRECAEIAKGLERYLSKFGDVCSIGLVDTSEKAEKCRLNFQKEDADIVIIAEVTFTPSEMVLPSLLKLNRPLIIWNTQKKEKLDEKFNFKDFMVNHGMSGVSCLTNVLVRNKIPYHMISGHVNDKRIFSEYEDIFKSAGAVKRLWGSRVGLIGHLYPGMLDFSYDRLSLLSSLGVSVVNITDSEIVKTFKAIPKNSVGELGKQIRKSYCVDNGFKNDEYNRSIRLALCLEKIVKEKNIDAVADYCQAIFQNPEIGVVPCLGSSLLMQKGVYFSCEGDVPSAVACMILGCFTEKTFFGEIWSNDFGNREVVMGHSGQQNPAIFKGRLKSVKVRPHPWWDCPCGRGASLELRMPAGEITILSMSPTDAGGWRLICASAEIADKPQKQFGVPNFAVRFKKPLPEFLSEWTHAGVSHHAAIAYGNWARYLKLFSEFAKVEFINVGVGLAPTHR